MIARGILALSTVGSEHIYQAASSWVARRSHRYRFTCRMARLIQFKLQCSRWLGTRQADRQDRQMDGTAQASGRQVAGRGFPRPRRRIKGALPAAEPSAQLKHPSQQTSATDFIDRFHLNRSADQYWRIQHSHTRPQALGSVRIKDWRALPWRTSTDLGTTEDVRSLGPF